jgi:transposase InsO family protein
MGFKIAGYDKYMRFKQYIKTISCNQIIYEKLKIIEFFDKHGARITKEAFDISRSTIYRWKKRYKLRWLPESLIPKSRRPKHTRRSYIDSKILRFIENIRENNHRFGKNKIKLLLDEYCEKERLDKISISTIGKIIKKNNWYFNPDYTESYIHNFRYNKLAKKHKKKKRLRLSSKYKTSYPGEVVQIDTIVRFDYHIKQYILTAIDLYSRFSFALSYKRLSSRIALDFYQKLEAITPFKITTVKTDNGLEFMGEFDNYLIRNNIKHYFIYPRTPKSNAYIERFNRTIQEEFVNANLDCMDDIEEFNSRLINYLVFFNSVRPHQSLGYLTPMGYLVSKGILSHMSVTNTIDSILNQNSL